MSDPIQKIFDAINDIKEQISIMDIQIAKELSEGKENKEQNDRRYKLQSELSSLELIYTTYLDDNIDSDINKNSTTKITNKNQGSSIQTTTNADGTKITHSKCNKCQFTWNATHMLYCISCGNTL